MPYDTISADSAQPSEMVGSTVKRREDLHLITGDTEHTDEIKYPGEAHLALLRSQFGHALIKDIDATGAGKIDGVLAAIQWSDIEASDAPEYMRTDDPRGSV